ncbi:MAG: glycosyltransferase [bacterium]|nr:glycosyltransferase [bacterium]
MRITLIVHQFPPRYFTGTEQYALAVGVELQRRGHDVDVFALDPAFAEKDGPWRESHETVEDLPVRRINFWMNLGRDWARMEYRHPFMAEVFERHLRDRGTEFVHSFHLRHLGADLLDKVDMLGLGRCISLMDFWFLCPRVILMKPDGTACDGPPDGGRGCLPCHAPELSKQLADHEVADQLTELHATSRGESKPGWDLRSKVASHLERRDYLHERLVRRGTIVAPTRFLRDVFINDGVPEDRIVHRSYGVTHTDLANTAATIDRPLTLGFLGSYAPHKAPHVLVDALKNVRGDCRAILRGRSTDFADYSRALAKSATDDPRIELLGPYERHELAEVLAAIDVLIVPSTWHENAPFVVLEARAAGLPVLASRFGGLSEVVDDEVDGELFTAGDSADLAGRLQRLVDEPERLARYRAAVQPPKSLAAAVDEFEAIYRGELG